MIKKEMIYFYDEEASTQPREMFAEGEIDGYEYIIISCGLYPIIYVKLPDDSEIAKIPTWGAAVNKLNRIYDFRGGVTYYSDSLYINGKELRGMFIGWSYNTDDDFIAGKYFENHANGKKWTTEELVEEAKAAIKAISKYGGQAK